MSNIKAGGNQNQQSVGSGLADDNGDTAKQSKNSQSKSVRKTASLEEPQQDTHLPQEYGASRSVHELTPLFSREVSAGERMEYLAPLPPKLPSKTPGILKIDEFDNLFFEVCGNEEFIIIAMKQNKKLREFKRFP